MRPSPFSGFARQMIAVTHGVLLACVVFAENAAVRVVVLAFLLASTLTLAYLDLPAPGEEEEEEGDEG